MTKQVHKVYSNLLDETRRKHLSPLEAFFSKVIHSRLGSIFATICEETIFRPTPLIIGLTVSIVGGLMLLGFAIIFGYTISSLESLGFFFGLGFVIGIIYEYLRFITKNPQRKD